MQLIYRLSLKRRKRGYSRFIQKLDSSLDPRIDNEREVAVDNLTKVWLDLNYVDNEGTSRNMSFTPLHHDVMASTIAN